MSRKATLCERRSTMRRGTPCVTPVVDVSVMALAFRDNNDEVIQSGYTKENFRNNDYMATLTRLSGLSINNIFKKICMLFPNDFICNVIEFTENRAGSSVSPVREVTVLYDVSGSMYYASNSPTSVYIPFHRKMGELFRSLEANGVNIRIYFFSSESISSRGSMSVEQFCWNERIPGGTTILGPAWNQLVHNRGSVLLVTDGQFTDSISNFNILSNITGLTLAVPSWTTVDNVVVQQLRNKLGTIPLEYVPACNVEFTIAEFTSKIMNGSSVVDLPEGYSRFGDIVFPKCWTSPSAIGAIINNVLRNHRDAIPNIFGNFIGIFSQIMCNMQIDFEGCIKSEDSRNLLQMVNIFMKISLREMNRIENESSDELSAEPSAEGSVDTTPDDNHYDYFRQMYDICKKIFDYGSNEKNNLNQKYSSMGLQSSVTELNTHWDSCFSSDESQDIIESHISDVQTHTIVLRTPLPYEIIRQIHVSSHALDKEKLTCLILYFSNGNFEIREGVFTGYGTIPVWNGNLIDSIRLIPSHTIFPDSDGVSFTFSITTAYRILMWLAPETMGPNKDIFP